MKPEELWSTFTETNIPDPQLESLGHDLYFAHAHPGKEGGEAIRSISTRLGMDPRHIYAAFNTDPGRQTLETLADEYDKRKSWKMLSPITQKYVARVAERIGIIKKASAAAITKAVTQNTRTSISGRTMSIIAFVLGTIASMIAATHG